MRDDDLTTLSRRVEGLQAWLDRHTFGRPRTGRVYVGQAYSGGSFPTAAGRYYLTHPVDVAGSEAEGGTATLTADTSSSVPVLILDGPMAVDDLVVAEMVAGRWVAEKGQGSGGGPTGSLPGCVSACLTPPATITMTAIPDGWQSGLFNSCSITYRATPSALVSLLGANGYYSTATFTDPSTGDAYYYNIGCFSSNISIRRVFEYSTPNGGPFVDSAIFSWTVGLPNNTCSPTFSLHNGVVFPGGDPTGQVYLDG